MRPKKRRVKILLNQYKCLYLYLNILFDIVQMKTLKLNHIQNFIVCSDVHLRNNNDEATKKFISEINNIRDVDAVFLLGDIFDFIAAPMSYFLNYWKNVFDACKQLKLRGIETYFTEGNHDFGFEHFNHPKFKECFTQCGDFAIELMHMKYGSIVLKHGDDVVCNGSYRPFRRIVKSKSFQKITTSMIPGSMVDFIFSRYAKLSRKGDQYRTLSHTFMNRKIEVYLKRYHSECDIFIMGHVHKEIDHMIHTTKSVRILIGQAWFDKPNFLKVSESEICRYFVE